MAYKDKIRKASFRGVPFFVSDTDTVVGRRSVKHEYPFRDVPYLEDTGRKSREFSIEGFVLGDDAISKLEAILDACERAGQGTLVHPFLGTKQVVVTSCGGRQRMKEGRIARLSFSFVEAGKSSFPSNVSDHGSIISSSTNLALTGTLKEAFTNTYTVSGPDFLKVSAISDVKSFFNMLKGIASVIPPQFTSDSILSFLGDINKTITEIGSFISDGIKLADKIISITTKTSGLIPISQSDSTDTITTSTSTLSPTINKLATVNAAIELTRFGESSDILTNPEPSSFGGTLSPITESTPARKQQRKNREAIVRLVRQAAVTEAMNAAIDVEYGSYEQASKTRDTIADKVEEQIKAIGDSDIGDDDSYEAMENLRAKTVKGLIEKGATLEKIVQFPVPQGIMSSLELAYDKYENVEREQEIIERNTSITHPGFLPAGNMIEILNA